MISGQNFRLFVSLLFISISISIVSCGSAAVNYPNAQILKVKNQTFIKLKGKRVLITHDIVSVFLNKTYEDSILIPIPKFQNGTIRGSQIPTEAGYYKYRGDVIIQKNKIQVNLYYDNTDDKVLEECCWNGTYYICNR